MAGNTDPIYSRAGDVQANSAGFLGSTANTAQDGTGTLYPIWQADTTNGGYIDYLSLQSVTTTAQTVLRVFVSTITGSWTGNTAANTWLLAEVTLPAVSVSQTVASPRVTVPLSMALPPGYRIVVGFGTSTGAATTGWTVIGIGGKY